MKLEIGSGSNPHGGYEHLDISKDAPDVDHVCDARKLPFMDNSVEEILCVNTIEHFWWYETRKLLQEWVRTLVPAGSIRLVTFDFAMVVTRWMGLDAYPWDALVDQEHLVFPFDSDKDKDLWLNYNLYSTHVAHNPHHSAFTYESLARYLVEAGCDMTFRRPAFNSLDIVGRKNPLPGYQKECSSCHSMDLTVHRELYYGMCQKCYQRDWRSGAAIQSAKQRNGELLEMGE